METLSLIGIILYYTIIIVGLTYASLIAYQFYLCDIISHHTCKVILIIFHHTNASVLGCDIHIRSTYSLCRYL
jgi:hypothetical protein